MEVYRIEGLGGPETLQRQVLSIIVPKDDEVVIRVSAVGVNKLDKLRTHRHFRMLEHWSGILGLECIGTVSRVDAEVNKSMIDKKVCTLLNGGGYATEVVVPLTRVIPCVENHMSDSCLACIPHAACLMWEALVRVGKLSEGMSLLVFTRCGTICQLAVQLAKVVKAKVIVAKSSVEAPIMQVYSPDHILDSDNRNFEQLVVMEVPDGVDIVLDCGVSNFMDATGCLKNGGTILLVDTMDVNTPELSFSGLVPPNATFQVIDRRSWTLDYTAEVVRGVKELIWPLFENKKLTLKIHPALFLFEDAVKAHQQIEGDDFNRVVLRL